MTNKDAQQVLEAILNEIERQAFLIPAPNPFTPMIVRGVIECRLTAQRLVEGERPSSDLIRDGVQIIKRRFLEWCNPPIRLPAESVIEDSVKDILDLWQSKQHRKPTPPTPSEANHD